MFHIVIGYLSVCLCQNINSSGVRAHSLSTFDLNEQQYFVCAKLEEEIGASPDFDRFHDGSAIKRKERTSLAYIPSPGQHVKNMQGMICI